MAKYATAGSEGSLTAGRADCLAEQLTAGQLTAGGADCETQERPRWALDAAK